MGINPVLDYKRPIQGTEANLSWDYLQNLKRDPS